MADTIVKFVYTSKAKFDALQTKDGGSLYFLQDVGQIYRGAELFTNAATIVTDFPATPATGMLYFNKTTREGKVHTGTEWITVIYPSATAVDDADVIVPVSGKAVADYVKANVTDLKYLRGVTYDQTGYQLKVTDDTETKDVKLTGLVKADGVSYVDGTLTLPVANGDDIVLNLPKENFVKSGSYDADQEAIVLVLQQPDEEGHEQKVVIPVSKLVDISSVTGSDTLTLSMNDQKVISGSVNISAVEGNLISAKSDGIYVAPVDQSGKLNVVDGTKVDEVVTVAADGQVKPSGIKIGAETLAETPGSSTLATESAVKASVDAAATKAASDLADGLATKVDKTAISTTIGASTAASDEKVASEKSVATVKETIENTITTEVEKLNTAIETLETTVGDDFVAKTAISTAIPAQAADAADTKVPSEKAVATVKNALEAADATLLETITNVNDAKVAKTDISTAIPAVVDDAVDTKVASEKAVKTALDAAAQTTATNLANGLDTKVDKAAISTAIPTDSAVDTKVASEKAVKDAIDGIKSEMTFALTWEVL